MIHTQLGQLKPSEPDHRIFFSRLTDVKYLGKLSRHASLGGPSSHTCYNKKATDIGDRIDYTSETDPVMLFAI